MQSLVSVELLVARRLTHYHSPQAGRSSPREPRSPAAGGARVRKSRTREQAQGSGRKTQLRFCGTELGMNTRPYAVFTRKHSGNGSDAKPVILLRKLVGAWRFELQTSCAQGKL